MERKMDFWTIEIATKFKDKEQALKLQKNIVDKFKYERDKHKDYMVQAIVGVSNINAKYTRGVYNNRTGKRGRAKKIKDIMEETEFSKKMFGPLHTDWHIHILVLSCPSETLAQIIKEYLDKKFNAGVTYKKFKDSKKTDSGIEMLFYIAKQSYDVKFSGSDDKRFKYTFRDMYNEMAKQYSKMLFNKKYITDENYRKKADKKYNDMISYFSQFYDEELKKEMERRYKEKVKRRKIAERYKQKEQKDYKVLKKRNIVSSEVSPFLGG